MLQINHLIIIQHIASSTIPLFFNIEINYNGFERKQHFSLYRNKTDAHY